ncbi:hypothetical protein [Asanoa sp. NPDC050611]|uniref:hypothetical protein n=1 Tax=Asanoa sp. NPDC050611 TaxID=3157098 RepID=UPI0033CA77A2
MSEVDFDLLADYVGGALAGTPDEARVAGLVATDAVWAAEHAALVAALANTADDLFVYAASTNEPMPDEVAVRLLAALPRPAAAEPAGVAMAEPADIAAAERTDAVAAEPADAVTAEPADAVTAEPADAVTAEPADAVTAEPADAAGAELGAAATGATSAAAAGPEGAVAEHDGADREATEPGAAPAESVAVPGQGGGRRGPHARRPEGGSGRPPGRAGATTRRRRARWLAWAAPALVAVMVAALAGVWISQSARTGTTGTNSAAGGAADSAAAAPEAASVPRYNTGTDYNSASVAGGFGADRQTLSSKSPATFQSDGRASQESSAKAVSPELARLGMGAALAVCFDAIAKELGQGPIVVSAADFASYDGRPAVIVFFTDASGAQWGWAVGPDCGPGGTDELFHSRVG